MSNILPIVWRGGQVWYLLEAPEQIVAQGFFVRFYSPEQGTMEFRKIIKARYVAVRVGRDAVHFWAVDQEGNNQQLRDTGARKPGWLCRADVLYEAEVEFAWLTRTASRKFI